MQRHTDSPGSELPGWTLGAVLAGGRSSRFGSEKALAMLEGVRLVRRAAAALAGAVNMGVVVTADPAVAEAAALPSRKDRTPEAGPLGGLVTALEWAVELGAGGVLAVAGDMPFLTSSGLLRLLRVASPPATAPVSTQGDLLQPLCAWYGVGLLDAASRRLSARELGLHALLSEAGAHTVAEQYISGDVSPSLFFMNVNTPADLEMAKAAARRTRRPDG